MRQTFTNLGCGSRFHPEWLNFDIHSTSPHVCACNILQGVPLADASCDAVYNAALLEHLHPAQASAFLRECHRILKPGGVLRIGVPDLERIAETYLQKLRAALAGSAEAGTHHEWMVFELIDQMVRPHSGGEMLKAIREGRTDDEFVSQRIGDEFRQLKVAPESRWTRLRQLPRQEAARRLWAEFLKAPTTIRRGLALAILGARDRMALREGFFRASGEVHRWMYDRYSLPRLLMSCGFRDPTVREFHSSAIAPDWPGFGLDTDEDGKPLKPDLLFVECVR
ncbi:MAG: methyltransferase domain-containing protein [Opitutaceae bacterium]|nr:methyltransferase domain-containing protein [Opitutaceae bacterium]